MARSALALSEPMGWNPWFGGGSRIEAIEALAAADPELGRTVAVERYSLDVGGRFVGGHRIVHHLERIAPLLFNNLPVLETWRHVEEYLDDLFGSSPVEPVSAVESAFDAVLEGGESDSLQRAISDLVALYIEHPSHSVAAWAVRAATRGLVGLDESATALMAGANRSELAAERVLAILDAAALTDPATVDPYRPWIETLTTHPNLFLRVRAVKLLATLDGVGGAVPLLDRPIPALYSFTLPPISSHRTGDEGRPATLGDPAQQVRPMDLDLRALADTADVDPDAVLLRAAGLAERFARDRTWLASEGTITPERINTFLDRGARLRIGYRKPHIAPVEQAVGHVAGELWDGERLDARDAEAFVHSYLRDDPHLVHLDAVPRPASISSMGGLDDPANTWSVPKGWLDRPGNSLGLLSPRADDGRYVLAEASTFAFLGSDTRMEEERYSLLGPRDCSILDRRFERSEPPFRSVDSLTVKAYTGGRTSDGSLVIRSSMLRAETPGAGWLALDPGMARDLGWVLSESGAFRWLDRDGNLMVESIWWADGLPERHDWRKQCVASEGWLVFATEEAFAQIANHVPVAHRTGFVYRRLGHASRDGWRGAQGDLPGKS